MSTILAWIIGGLLLGVSLLVVAVVAARRSPRRKEWAPILEQEAARWEAKSYEELLSGLNDVQSYELTFDSKHYQIEVELLERTASYLHAAVTVDDGTLPASLVPVSKTFLCRAPGLYGRAS